MNSGEMENSSASRLVLLRLFLVLRGFVEGVSGSPVGAEGMAGGGGGFFLWVAGFAFYFLLQEGLEKAGESLGMQ